MRIVYLLFLIVFCFPVFSQGNDANNPADSTLLSVDSDEEDQFSIYPFPFILISPETELGIGEVTLFTFRFKNDLKSSRMSQFQIGFTYTQLNQLLFYVPFQLYYKDDSFGQLGYYRFSYFFYGIGSDAKDEDEELYDVNFPRVNVNVLQEIKPSWYFGLKYKMESHDIKEREDEGQLSNNRITGSNGGTISALGLISIFDDRNNYNFPSSGNLLEVTFLPNLKAFGSDFNFSRLSVDYSKYLSVNENIFAFNLFAVSVIGDAPFNELAFIGGRDKMRGYYEGRFRDNNLLMGQAEYRRIIYKNFGLVLFTGFGAVADDYSNFDLTEVKPSGGLGLRYRFDEEDKLNIRMDVGFGENGNSGVYLTLGEAF